MSLSNKGFTLFMTPNCFATSITPSVPVNFRRNFAANFLAFKSSSSNNGDSISLAKAIALASPKSICDSIEFFISRILFLTSLFYNFRFSISIE